MLKLKDYDHPYYASESNYYCNDASTTWETASEFLDEFEDADVDMNQVFRFDLTARDEGKHRWMAQVIIIGQRKGLYMSQNIKHIDDTEVERLEAYLAKHWVNMQKLWSPFVQQTTRDNANIKEK